MGKVTWDYMRSNNEAAGRFFWSPGAVKCFRSRDEGQPRQGPGGVFFVVSTQFVGSDGVAAERRFRVCEYDMATAHVRTVTDELSREQAFAFAGRAARFGLDVAREAETIDEQDLRAAGEFAGAAGL